MGTVRAWLRDDVETPAWRDRSTTYEPVAVDTADEPPATVPTTTTVVNPRLTVRLRTRTGYDDDGVPQFTWTTLVEGEATLYEEREEVDAEAGVTRIAARAVLLYAGSSQVPETASVTRDDGVIYRVVAVRQVPGRLEFDLIRLASG